MPQNGRHATLSHQLQASRSSRDLTTWNSARRKSVQPWHWIRRSAGRHAGTLGLSVMRRCLEPRMTDIEDVSRRRRRGKHVRPGTSSFQISMTIRKIGVIGTSPIILWAQGSASTMEMSVVGGKLGISNQELLLGTQYQMEMVLQVLKPGATKQTIPHLGVSSSTTSPMTKSSFKQTIKLTGPSSIKTQSSEVLLMEPKSNHSPARKRTRPSTPMTDPTPAEPSHQK